MPIEPSPATARSQQNESAVARIYGAEVAQRLGRGDLVDVLRTLPARVVADYDPLAAA